MKTFATLAELQHQVGEELGVSDWIEVTQERIQLFADATGDHQWIHLDRERAAAGPFGTTIAHGFLTLSLLPEMSAKAFAVSDTRMGVNYGLNRVRFPAPVPSGSRLRGRFKLLKYEPIEGGAQMIVEVKMEREGADKPVCIAESVVAALHMTPAITMKVLLIDDHPLILTALQNVIQGIGSHVSVLGVAGARRAREALAADPAFDLVLLDLRLGDADGFELLAELRATYPAVPVVVVSASDRSADVIRAIDLGAMGFVPKRASNETLQEALHVVMQGGIYVPQMAMSEGGDGGAAESAHVAHPAHPQGDAPAAPRAALAAFKLTPRQTDVLGLLLRGQSNKLIARELNLSVETVKDHVAAVLRTLGVNSRTQAVLAVSQMSSQGGITPWPPRATP